MMPEVSRVNKVVVTDTSCFIILQKINALHILHSLFTAVLTTPEIAKEVGHPLPNWVIVQSASDKSLQEEFKRYVDAGEASALALATETSCDFLILDDAEARRFAEKLGLPVKGTAGILLAAKQAGIITLVRPYFNLIEQTNFRIAPSLINKILLDAGEDLIDNR